MRGRDFLSRFAAEEERASQARLLVVAAHPDDEVIGLGGQFPRLPRLSLLHVTDGAPRGGSDAAAQGFRMPEAYADARRRELAEALALAGRGSAPMRCLAIPDQAASLLLAQIARDVAETLRAEAPEVVVTHPYEGGHPDHDATALAVQVACRLLQMAGDRVPARVEMTSYHAGPGGIATGRFLPAAEGSAPVLLALSPEAQALKSRMLACFSSQQAMLRHFPVGAAEALRPAPVHDASRPPHPGPLFYEGFPWGMTGPRFRALAATALEELGIGTAP